MCVRTFTVALPSYKTVQCKRFIGLWSLSFFILYKYNIICWLWLNGFQINLKGLSMYVSLSLIFFSLKSLFTFFLRNSIIFYFFYFFFIILSEHVIPMYVMTCFFIFVLMFIGFSLPSFTLHTVSRRVAVKDL